MKRRYTSLCQFIFFVLLQEGKSNLPYRLYLLVCGEQFTTLHYFKKLFAGCDTNTYQHYCSMYEKSNHVPLQLPKGYCGAKRTKKSPKAHTKTDTSSQEKLFGEIQNSF